MRRLSPILSICAVLAILAVAGAAIIEVPDAVGRITGPILGGSTPAEAPTCETEYASQSSADNYDYASSAYFATNFTTPGSPASADICKITVPVCFISSGEAGNTITAEIRTTTSGHPSSVAITNGTSTNQESTGDITVCTSYATLEFEFTSATVSASTEYWIVLHRSGGERSLQWNGVSASGHDYWYSSDGTNWTQLDADIGGLYVVYR